MASRNLIRGTTFLLASRLISSQAPKILKYQSFKKCMYPSSAYLSESQNFSTSNRHLAGAFECINIQDSEDFKSKVLQSPTPVVVDFHATWCGPCKILAPRLEAIISEKKGKVLMAKVDIDENSDLAMKYEVRSVPMVVSIKNGKIQDSFIGVKDDDILEEFVEKLL